MERFSIGSKVGRGAQHIVGRLADGSLIKYPHPEGTRWDASTAETAKRDLNIHQRWGIPIPEARVSSAPEIDDGRRLLTPPYAIIVEEIKGRVFREADLEDDDIRGQITDLTGRSLEIKERLGAGLDFLGGAAFKNFLAYLALEYRPGRLGAYNIIVDARDRITLIDTNLLDPNRAPAGLKKAINAISDLQNGLMTNLLRNGNLANRYLAGAPSRTAAALSEKLYSLSRRIESRRIALAGPAATAGPTNSPAQESFNPAP